MKSYPLTHNHTVGDPTLCKHEISFAIVTKDQRDLMIDFIERHLTGSYIVLDYDTIDSAFYLTPRDGKHYDHPQVRFLFEHESAFVAFAGIFGGDRA